MKRKLFQKLMAASLTAAMVVGAAGCSGKNNPASNSGSSEQTPSSADASSTTPAEPEQEVSKYTVLTDENGNPYDLGGMKITVWSWFTEDTEVKDDYSEAVAEWRQWIQETYNFTYSVEQLGSWDDCHTSFVDYVTTGGDENNYIFVGNNAGGMISAMQQGLMYDVAKIAAKYDWLDFSDRKFQLNGQCNLFAKGDSIYAFNAGYPEPRDGMFFNIRLLEQTTGMKADDIYDLQKNNEWTWDKWEEIMKKIMAGGDTNNDGVQDIYPFGCNRGTFASTAVYSNGSRYFGLEDGKYVYKLEDPKTIKALEWSVDMMDKYLYREPSADAQWDYFKAAFRDEGKFVFLPEQGYQMTNNGEYNNMEDERGFVMFPMGPDATGYVNAHDDNVYALPGCYDDEKAWKIMFAFNLWTEPIPGYEDINPFQAQYANYADNLRTAEETVPRMCTEGGTVKYESFIPNVDMGEPFLWKVNPGADIPALIEGVAAMWKTAVDEANK